MRWLKEIVRPYYLRWIYFPLHPSRRPQAFHNCWQYPFDKLTESVRLPQAASHLPDLVFYPMTDWHARIQRTQHLARSFARLGYRVISINPHLGREFESTPLCDRSHRLSRLEPNVFELHVRLPREPVFHHRLLSPREEAVVADAVARVLPKPARAIQMVSFPLWLGVARRFRDEQAFPIVYDCHDLLSGFGNIAGDLIEAEKDLLRTADLVLFSSHGLMDRYRGVKRGMLVRNAVNAAAFPNAPAPVRAAVAGYVGALDSWFDVEAVEQSAKLHPECRFVLAGRMEYEPIQRLRALPNVEFPGEIPYGRVPELLAQFRIALIPFRINPLTLMTNPIKLYEYFSCGLPVVSTPLPEAEAMGDLVYVGETPGDFAREVGRALAEDDPSRSARRREIAVRESWDARVRDLGSEFEKLIARRGQ
jgi:glycosyltransferase involved in cell wall biosynthesis